MRFIKNFNEYKRINEDVNYETFTTENVKIIHTSTKERLIERTIVVSHKAASLAERGPELINQAVMKKGENPDSLDLNIDSERLEYAWRMISKDVDGAIKVGKIEKDGRVVASNIKKNDKGEVDFDFTFENKDSVQNIDPSGKTTKTMLAGKIIPEKFESKTEQVNQVWIVLKDIKAAIDLKDITDKVDFFNRKMRLIEAGYLQIKGTYSFKLPTKGEWVAYDKDNNTKIIEFFQKNVGSYFDVKELYSKFGIDPNTKKATGKPNWAINV